MTNEQDTEDILQDVFLKIHSNIDDLKDANKISSWIYRITRNAIVDYYRKQSNQPIVLKNIKQLIVESDDDVSANGEISLCLKANRKP